jgi:hypothetical protein
MVRRQAVANGTGGREVRDNQGQSAGGALKKRKCFLFLKKKKQKDFWKLGRWRCNILADTPPILRRL